MIVRDGLAIAVPGVLIGAPCAWAAARLVRAQLYGIAPSDSRTLLIGRSHISCDGARGVIVSGAARVEGSARRSTA
jgi:sensor histidine kinase regulating citrate/malate metabolism